MAEQPQGRAAGAGVLAGVPGLTDVIEVGRGGFAVVYRAQQVAFQRVVAVKVISRLDLDGNAVRRFERECAAMGSLSWHPHIVVVFDAGTTTTGMPYLVMEYLEHGSLGERVARSGPMPWREVLSVGVQLAGALQTAHDAALLHRDIKPENVMVGYFGEVKLGDFGIAVVQGGTETGSGQLTATVAHAAPEVLAGDRATVASDVYSFGSTLYALLAGMPAFLRPTDESVVPVILRVTRDPVPDLRPLGVPGALASLVEAAMHKDPQHRPRDAAAVAAVLQDLQRQHGLPVTDLRLRRRLEDGSDAAGATASDGALPAPPEGSATHGGAAAGAHASDTGGSTTPPRRPPGSDAESRGGAAAPLTSGETRQYVVAAPEAEPLDRPAPIGPRGGAPPLAGSGQPGVLRSREPVPARWQRSGPGQRGRHRAAWAGAVSAALLVVSGLLLLLTRQGGAETGEWLATPPAVHGSEVVTTWTWEFAGRDTVDVELHYRNIVDHPVQVRFDEYVPAAIVPTREALPAGVDLVEGRTVLRFDLELPQGADRTIQYRVNGVDGVDAGDDQRDTLREWADEQHEAQEQLQPDSTTFVRDAIVRPSRLQLVVGEQARMTLNGVDTTGGGVVPGVLDALDWRSSDEDVAVPAVADADLVTRAVAPGEAVLTARLGSAELEVHVTVDAATADAASGVCEPGAGEAQRLSRHADGTVLRDESGGVFVVNGGGRLAIDSPEAFDQADFTAEDVIDVTNEQRDAIPTIPRNGTVLREPGGGPVLVLGGAAFQIADEAQAARLGYPRTTARTVPPGSLAHLRPAPVDGSLLRPNGRSDVILFRGERGTAVENACRRAAVLEAPSDDARFPL